MIKPPAPTDEKTPDPIAAKPMEQPDSVLFVCNFNIIRSPMAEALTKHYCGHRIFVDSVGIRADDSGPNPFAIVVMEEIGLDISRHQAKLFNELMDTSYDLVVSLSPEAHHKALELTRTMSCDVEYWPTLDPTLVSGNRETILEAFRATRDHLSEKIRKRFDVGYSPAI